MERMTKMTARLLAALVLEDAHGYAAAHKQEFREFLSERDQQPTLKRKVRKWKK